MGKTFNYYLTKDLQSAPQEREVIYDTYEVDGIRCYKVIPPLAGEVVVGYVSFSDFLTKPTLTEKCEVQ